jgi:hypothetical protein
METKGQLLKHHLGLDSYDEVKYVRIIGTAGFRVYLVFFDSRLPRRMIMNAEVKSFYNSIQSFLRDGSKPEYTNVLPISSFMSSETGAVFIRIDLAGRYRYKTDYDLFLTEKKIDRRILERLKLKDLQTTDAISQFILDLQGTLPELPELVGVDYKRGNLYLTLHCRAGSAEGGKVSVVNPPDFSLRSKRKDFYSMTVKVEGYAPAGTSPDELMSALDGCNIYLYNENPSFYFQGFAYNLTQLDACLYPCNIKPERWDKHHGDTFLDKHSAAFFINFDRYRPLVLKHLTRLFPAAH